MKDTEAKGGLTNGASHDDGGIKMTVKSTGQKVELEGGEGVVNKRNMSSTETKKFEGKEMTNCEIISAINTENGNGVKFNCDEIEGKNFLEEGGKILDIGIEDEYEAYNIKKKKDHLKDAGIRDTNEIVKIKNSLGYNREQLPQLRSHYKDAFLDKLKSDGAEIHYYMINPNELQPSQKEINFQKIRTMTEEVALENNVVVSKDLFIIDGHHRWYYHRKNNKSVPVMQIDLPFTKLIEELKGFDKTEFSDVHAETFSGGGNVLCENDEQSFNEWIEDGNAHEISDNVWVEQTTGWQKRFTKNELRKFFKKEYLEYAKGGVITKEDIFNILPIPQQNILGNQPISLQNEQLENVKKALIDIPKLHKQDGKGQNAIVYLHYFVGGSDWFITEYDRENKEFFGYAILNGDVEMSEFGYMPTEFFKNADYGMKTPELDLYWKYKTLNEIFEKEYPSLVRKPIERYKNEEKSEVVVDLKNRKFKNRYQKNVFIQALIDEKGDDPNNYSVEEKEIISQYTGMGGLEKQGATSDEDQKGLLYEYYTPSTIAEFMWGLAYKHQRIGIKNVLEPSVGIGVYCETAPKGVLIEGFDISKYAISICKILYPNHSFNNSSFEKMFINRNKSVGSKVEPQFDLVIGNPPFGKYQGYYSAMGEKTYTKANDFIEYFISRGLDLLKPGGLLVFIIGTIPNFGSVPLLDKEVTAGLSKIREKSDLVDAYRLGSGMFETTDVDSDVIVLRKK